MLKAKFFSEQIRKEPSIGAVFKRETGAYGSGFIDLWEARRNGAEVF
jgi:hypothetical protein